MLRRGAPDLGRILHLYPKTQRGPQELRKQSCSESYDETYQNKNWSRSNPGETKSHQPQVQEAKQGFVVAEDLSPLVNSTTSDIGRTRFIEACSRIDQIVLFSTRSLIAPPSLTLIFMYDFKNSQSIAFIAHLSRY
jgi:hypothetical protein